jgi:hypothetical protein
MTWTASNLSTWREPGGLVEDIHRADPGQSDEDQAEDD